MKKIVQDVVVHGGLAVWVAWFGESFSFRLVVGH
jgi:hypothetical protein